MGRNKNDWILHSIQWLKFMLVTRDVPRRRQVLVKSLD